MTRNEMTVRTIAVGGYLVQVTGAGYAPDGELFSGREKVEGSVAKRLQMVASAGLLCSDASLRAVEGRWVATGDPTDAALVAFAMKVGLDPAFEKKQRPRTDVIPFESEHRVMATMHHDDVGNGFIYVKGGRRRARAAGRVRHFGSGAGRSDRGDPQVRGSRNQGQDDNGAL